MVSSISPCFSFIKQYTIIVYDKCSGLIPYQRISTCNLRVRLSSVLRVIVVYLLSCLDVVKR